MSKATLDQASKILDLCRDLRVSREAIQCAITSGAMGDLLTSPKLHKLDRNAHRELLGHEPLVPLLPKGVIDIGKRPKWPKDWKIILPDGQGDWRQATQGDFSPGANLFTWDSSKVELIPGDDSELDPNGYIDWHKVKKNAGKLSQRLLNANHLEYLLDNPDQIPESWNGQMVLFWGTVFVDGADLGRDGPFEWKIVKNLYRSYNEWTGSSINLTIDRKMTIKYATAVLREAV